MKLNWLKSLEGKLVSRLAAISVLAMLVGFVGLLVKSYRIAKGLSDEGAADRFVGEFLKEAAWTFPLFAAVVLGIVVVTVRSSLGPIKTASARAAAITPAATGVRLDPVNIPTELEPLVSAINGALDRLELGFEAHRRFTSDAAHELRTPLAILTTGLEALPDTSEVARLRQDAGRMTRLVEQLLRVARLDALPLNTAQSIDLGIVAAETIEQLAPWAVSLDRTLAYEAPTTPVVIQGNGDALAGAIRNLVENAIHHTPAGTEVVVVVRARAEIRVIDHGPGVPIEHRVAMFERFWRGPGETRQGVGLGLSIVSQVAKAHRGHVGVEDTPGGGATIVLRFRCEGPNSA